MRDVSVLLKIRNLVQKGIFLGQTCAKLYLRIITRPLSSKIKIAGTNYSLGLAIGAGPVPG